MIGNLTNKLISNIGVREKYLRNSHFNTIKVWWARRPITAMRALIVNEIHIRNKSVNLVDLNLIAAINPKRNTFNKFRKENKSDEFTLLDVFSGGGSIPFESSRLGLNTFSAELNPIAVLLQETIFRSLEINDYPKLLYDSGINVINRLRSKYEKFYHSTDCQIIVCHVAFTEWITSFRPITSTVIIWDNDR